MKAAQAAREFNKPRARLLLEDMHMQASKQMTTAPLSPGSNYTSPQSTLKKTVAVACFKHQWQPAESTILV